MANDHYLKEEKSEENSPENKAGRFFFGVLLTAGFFFLVVSLVSYSPSDYPGGLVYPADQTKPVQNIGGRFGAVLASGFLNFCGVGAWFLLFPCFLRLLSYWRGRLTSPIYKTIGVFLLLIAVSGLASFLLTETSAGPVIGPGGWLGAMTRVLCLDHFSIRGSYVFLMSLFVAGMIFACDGSLLRFFLWITGIYTFSELILGFFRGAEKAKDGSAANTKKAILPKPTPLPELSKETSDSSTVAREATDSTERRDGFDSNTAEKNVKELEILHSTGSDATGSGATGATDGTGEADEMDAADRTGKADAPDLPDEEEKIVSSIEGHQEEIVTEVKSEGDEWPPPREYVVPPMTLLSEQEPCNYDELDEKIREMGYRLEKAFADYGFEVRVIGMQSGPVLTLYEIELARGLRLMKIMPLANDLAVVLKVPSVRLVAPIPGKNTVGVEIPNAVRQLVLLREIMEESAEEAEKMALPLFLGRSITGGTIVTDLTKLPHLLIAGRTGTGKSVCLNSIILSVLMTRKPDQVRMIMIDPKMVELSPYQSVPHLMHPVVTDMKKAEAILGWAVDQMEGRYALLKRVGARQISEYNNFTPQQLRARFKPESDEEWNATPRKLPYIIIIADEMSDMMMMTGKEAENYIIRLAQKSRAIGIHLVLATQKPTVDVITGQIKSNLPARIAFGVASRTDSMVVLDAKGAEQLLGDGDFLYLRPGGNQAVRGQGTFVSREEMETIVAEIATDRPDFVTDLMTLFDEDDSKSVSRAAELLRNKDPYYDEAVTLVISEGRGSTSFLQQRLGIGYSRASRIIETMAAEGVITPYNRLQPLQAREVLLTLEQWQELNGVGPAAEAAAAKEAAETAKRMAASLEATPETKPKTTGPIVGKIEEIKPVEKKENDGDKDERNQTDGVLRNGEVWEAGPEKTIPLLKPLKSKAALVPFLSEPDESEEPEESDEPEGFDESDESDEPEGFDESEESDEPDEPEGFDESDESAEDISAPWEEEPQLGGEDAEEPVDWREETGETEKQDESDGSLWDHPDEEEEESGWENFADVEETQEDEDDADSKSEAAEDEIYPVRPPKKDLRQMAKDRKNKKKNRHKKRNRH